MNKGLGAGGGDVRGEGLKSILEANSLDDFLAAAEMADRDFTTARTAAMVVVPLDKKPAAAAEGGAGGAGYSFEYERLPVPRRPAWTKTMSAKELHRREKDSFLEWRRGLATLEEGDGMMLTPFEKNLEVWRQLWRVLERSQLVVQIVDARNPLLFRCIDLERYVAELCKVKEKRSLLLVNKADLLTPEQRTRWADYFHKHRIPFLFFSAVVAQTVLDGDGVSDIARHAAPPRQP